MWVQLVLIAWSCGVGAAGALAPSFIQEPWLAPGRAVWRCCFSTGGGPLNDVCLDLLPWGFPAALAGRDAQRGFCGSTEHVRRWHCSIAGMRSSARLASQAKKDSNKCLLSVCWPAAFSHENIADPSPKSFEQTICPEKFTGRSFWFWARIFFYCSYCYRFYCFHILFCGNYHSNSGACIRVGHCMVQQA